MTESITDAATVEASGTLVDAEAPMKPSTRRVLTLIGVAALVMVVALAWIYFVEGRKYATTDNAQIDGDKISVNAPATGTLTHWSATEGARVVKHQVLGRIQIQAGFTQPQHSIRAPGDGTVVIDSGVDGAFVATGTPLAIAYDLSKVFVTARFDETEIDDIRMGQAADIEVDAFPGIEFTGSVTTVQGGAAGTFSPLPQSNTAGNFQKVTQVIPVKIAIDDARGLALVPGMNVTVKIRKDR